MQPFFWEREGIRLRNFLEEDVETLKRSFSKSEYRMQIEKGIGLPQSTYDVEGFIQVANMRALEERDIYLAVADESDHIVGYTTVTGIDERNGVVSFYVTIFPEYSGHGYGTQVSDVMLTYLFRERRMHRVELQLLEENLSGIALAKKLGFVKEGEKRDQFYSHGKYYDTYLFGMVKKEFEAGFPTENAKNQKENTWNFSKADGYENAQGIEAEQINQTRHLKNPYEFHKNFWHFEDILIRPLKESDCFENRELLYDTASARFYDRDVHLPVDIDELSTKEQGLVRFDGADGRLAFALENEDGEYVGNVQLFSMDEKNGTFSFSFFILTEYRGMGYATKALWVVLHYAFFELRLHKCDSRVDAANMASIQAMKNVGMKVEAIARQTIYYDGQYVDELHLGMVEQDVISDERKR